MYTEQEKKQETAGTSLFTSGKLVHPWIPMSSVPIKGKLERIFVHKHCDQKVCQKIM